MQPRSHTSMMAAISPGNAKNAAMRRSKSSNHNRSDTVPLLFPRRTPLPTRRRKFNDNVLMQLQLLSEPHSRTEQAQQQQQGEAPRRAESRRLKGRGSTTRHAQNQSDHRDDSDWRRNRDQRENKDHRDIRDHSYDRDCREGRHCRDAKWPNEALRQAKLPADMEERIRAGGATPPWGSLTPPRQRPMLGSQDDLLSQMRLIDEDSLHTMKSDPHMFRRQNRSTLSRAGSHAPLFAQPITRAGFK